MSSLWVIFSQKAYNFKRILYNTAFRADVKDLRTYAKNGNILSFQSARELKQSS